MTLFFLVCLEYLEELLVGIWVIGVACLYLIEVLDCVVELAGGLGVEGIPGAEAAEEGGSSGGALGEGVEGLVGSDGARGEIGEGRSGGEF